jgi:hypothetical protein
MATADCNNNRSLLSGIAYYFCGFLYVLSVVLISVRWRYVGVTERGPEECG